MDADSQYLAFFRDAVDLDLADFDQAGPLSNTSQFYVGEEVSVQAPESEFSGYVSAVASSWLMVHDGVNERIVCPKHATQVVDANRSNKREKAPWRQRVLNFS